MSAPAPKQAVTQNDPAKKLKPSVTADDIARVRDLGEGLPQYTDDDIKDVIEAAAGSELVLLPSTVKADIAALQTDITVLDDTVGQLDTETNRRIDRLEAYNPRLEALKLAVEHHGRITGGTINGSTRTALTATADTLLAWLVGK